MDVTQRLQVVEEWVGWLRGELAREVDDLVVTVASQVPLEQSFGMGLTAAATAVSVGRRHVADHVEPLLQVLDQVCEHLRYAQVEAAAVAR